jgi:hypothetical protein
VRKRKRESRDISGKQEEEGKHKRRKRQRPARDVKETRIGE